MRRLLSLLLLAAFGLPAAAQALALSQQTDAHIPVCCRRNGAHHCSSNMAERSNAPAYSAICPQFPQPASSVPARAAATAAVSPSLHLLATLAAAHLSFAQNERPETRQTSHHKRGPPADLL
jgi:hypothetical protein